jgi:hypothetical protein
MKSQKHYYKFAILGLSGSGKTCFISALGASHRPNSDGSSCIAVPAEPKDSQEIKEGYLNLEENLRLLDEGKLPHATEIQLGVVPKHRFIYSDAIQGQRYFEIDDYSGELLNPALAASDNSFVKTLRAKMRGIDGVVILASVPDKAKRVSEVPNELSNIVKAFIALKASDDDSEHDFPVALVLSQWDKQSDIPENDPDAENAVLEKFIGANPGYAVLVDQLTNVNRDGWFGVSPVSALGKYTPGQPVQRDPMMSYGLEFPFGWLFRQSDALRMRNLAAQYKRLPFCYGKLFPYFFNDGPVTEIKRRLRSLRDRLPASQTGFKATAKSGESEAAAAARAEQVTLLNDANGLLARISKVGTTRRVVAAAALCAVVFAGMIADIRINYNADKFDEAVSEHMRSLRFPDAIRELCDKRYFGAACNAVRERHVKDLPKGVKDRIGFYVAKQDYDSALELIALLPGLRSAGVDEASVKSLENDFVETKKDMERRRDEAARNKISNEMREELASALGREDFAAAINVLADNKYRSPACMKVGEDLFVNVLGNRVANRVSELERKKNHPEAAKLCADLIVSLPRLKAFGYDDGEINGAIAEIKKKETELMKKWDGYLYEEFRRSQTIANASAYMSTAPFKSMRNNVSAWLDWCNAYNAWNIPANQQIKCAFSLKRNQNCFNGAKPTITIGSNTAQTIEIYPGKTERIGGDYIFSINTSEVKVKLDDYIYNVGFLLYDNFVIQIKLEPGRNEYTINNIDSYTLIVNATYPPPLPQMPTLPSWHE